MGQEYIIKELSKSSALFLVGKKKEAFEFILSSLKCPSPIHFF